MYTGGLREEIFVSPNLSVKAFKSETLFIPWTYVRVLFSLENSITKKICTKTYLHTRRKIHCSLRKFLDVVGVYVDAIFVNELFCFALIFLPKHSV